MCVLRQINIHSIYLYPYKLEVYDLSILQRLRGVQARPGEQPARGGDEGGQEAGLQQRARRGLQLEQVCQRQMSVYDACMSKSVPADSWTKQE